MINVFIIVLIAYLLLGTTLAYFSRRYGVKSSSDYFVAGYKLGGFLSAMTYAATTYSAFMMVGLVGLAYATGVGALGFELIYLLATLVLLSSIAPKAWAMARERGWVSPSEMLSDLYNSRILGYLVAATYLVALLPYTSAQLSGIAVVFEGIGLSYGLGVVVGVALLILWIVLAGMWSVAVTDAYQGLWMIFSAIALITWLTLYFIPLKGVSINDLTVALSNAGFLGLTNFWSFNTFLAYTLPWIFFAVTNPQVVVRIFVPKDGRAYKNMIFLFSIYGFTYTIIAVYVGLLSKGLTLLNLFENVAYRDLVTPKLLLNADPTLASIIYVSIIAAAISTANSIVLAVASSFVRDVYEKAFRGKHPLRVANALVLALSMAAAGIAFLRTGFIVDLSVLTSVILLPLAPTTILAWFNPNVSRSREARIAAIASITSGVVLALGAATYLGPRATFLSNWGGLPISFWVLTTSTIISLIGFTLGKLKSSRG